MAKGWYVIWTEDTEEFKYKSNALKRAKEIYKGGLDKEVFIQQFNDDWDDGYFSRSSAMFIKYMLERNYYKKEK